MKTLPPQTLLSLAGAGILAAILVALSFHVPGSIWVGTLARKNGVIGLLLAAALLYFAGCWLVLHRPVGRRAVWLVLGVAVAMRVALLAAPPMMSSDVYRYVWDGRVQAAGFSPYTYIPADPALARLRDDAIYPRINRADYAPTIYPPMAQAVFHAIGLISQTVTATKIAMVLLEAAGIAAMLRLLTMAGLPAAHVLIYAWNPLAAWSVAGEGHIDAAAIGLLGLALLARATDRSGLTGAFLGAAILTKFLPAAVAPALWRRWGVRMPAAAAATIIAMYACYIGAGWKVLGFLPAYTHEEGLARGSGFWLLGLLGRVTPLPSAASALYLAAAAILLGAVAAYVVFQSPRQGQSEIMRVGGNAAVLLAASLCVLSAHYAWYYPILALPACLRPWPSLIYLSTAPILLYSDPFHDEILLPTLVFVPALLLALRDLHRARNGMSTAPAWSLS